MLSDRYLAVLAHQKSAALKPSLIKVVAPGPVKKMCTFLFLLSTTHLTPLFLRTRILCRAGVPLK